MRLSIFVLLIGALLVTVSSACGSSEADPSDEIAIDEQLIVKFIDDSISADVQAILDQYDAVRIRPDLDLGGAWLLRVDPEKRAKLIEELGSHLDVEYAEPDLPVELRDD